jgi:hypothetical protein
MLLMPVPGTFCANYVLDKYGIRISMLIFSFIFVLASWLRCLVNVGDIAIPILILSSCLIGFGSPFVMNALN